ncbi:MAG TPA: hypothetical protein VFU29_10555 [Chitinophagaceae bacterium]|nr:hypothetical protein [Chitinophagaceae bacterium]
MEILIARGRHTHKGNAVQTLRGRFSFIADYLEDPAVTEQRPVCGLHLSTGKGS